MALMPLTPNANTIDQLKFSGSEKKQLLALARRAVEHCVTQRTPYRPREDDFPESFLQPAACFVTLKQLGNLRGCIGSLEAQERLIDDLCHNACAAAQADPRFNAVTPSELNQIEISISILSSPRKLMFESEDDLIRQLEPGADGLILNYREHRATFLPVVWEALPKPNEFLQELKRKAGLPADFWSNEITVSRYTTTSIP